MADHSTTLQRPRGGLLQQLPVLLFVVILAGLVLRAPALLTPLGLDLILQQATPLLVMTMGLAVIVIGGGDDVVSGGIDLSLPANAVLVSAVIARLASETSIGFLPIVIIGGLVAVAAAGLNLILILKVGMTPLLATLATSVALSGLTDYLTSARRITVTHPALIFLRDEKLGFLSVSVLVAVLVAFVFIAMVHRTRWGLHLQATGGNAHAAELAGIRTGRITVTAFLLAGLSAAVAGPLLLARGSGYSPGAAENLLLEVVLATFLGAAFSPRRIVTVWGAALGALLVTSLSVGFRSAGVDIFWTGCIKGGLILVVVASASLANRSRS